jgi:hypothetical protein
MIIVHSYIIFMMSMTLITDFASVLLDTTDNQVILPRPVNSKTLFMARLVHILIYLLQFTIALAVVPVGCTFFKFGVLTGLGLCITALLSVLVAVFFTYLLYLFILRFSNEQKVKEIITYFQIVMTVIFTVGLQILPRILNVFNFELHLHWYSYLLPPVWMALALEMLHTLQVDSLHLLMTALSVFLPILLFWILNRFLAPSFARKLSAMNTDGAQSKQELTEVKQGKSVSGVLSGIFCRDKVEQGAFEMTWKMTGRDKSFRLQFYPSLGYIVVFVFIFVFKNGQHMGETWSHLGSTNSYLWFIYLPLFTISNSLLLVSYNENYMASWVYHSLPVEHPGQLITGSAKSLLVKYFIIVYLLLFAICLYVWGIAIADDFLFGFFNNVLCFLLFAYWADHFLPFSRQPNTQQQSGRFVRVMLQLAVVAALVGLHYLLIPHPWIMYALMPFIIGGCFLLLRKLQRLPWRKIAI